MGLNPSKAKLFKEEIFSRNIRLSSRLILGGVFTVCGMVLIILGKLTGR